MYGEQLNEKEFKKLKEESQPEVPEEFLELQKQAKEVSRLRKERERERIKKTKKEYGEMGYSELNDVWCQVPPEEMEKQGFDYDTFLEIISNKTEEEEKAEEKSE